MSEFSSNTTDFLNWFKSQQGAVFHDDLELTDLRLKGAGRGIIAKRDIPDDTELFSIPRSSILSVENSEISKALPEVFSTLAPDSEQGDDIEVPDPWIDLILVMIYEFLQGSNSRWQPYFAILPDQFDTLMFWESSELDGLQASAIRDKVGKSEADLMFRQKIVPVVKRHSAHFYPSGASEIPEDDVVKLAHRMGSTIMSYAFELEQDEGEDSENEDGWTQDREGLMAMGMVPMADMLNADAEFNAHLNHDEERLTMTSLRHIKAGEEVLNFYGPLANGELLRRYGYTSPKHNRYDVVEISWQLIKGVIDDQFKVDSKADLDEDSLEDSFVLERDTGFPDFDGVNRSQATFTTFGDDLETQTKAFIASAMGLSSDTPSKADVRRIKTAFAEVMSTALSKRLAEFSTSADQDEEELRGDIQGRERMAVEVRLGEKKVLGEALALIRNLLNRYRQAAPTMAVQGEPATKKQKTTK